MIVNSAPCISIVVPVFNESRGLDTFADEIQSVMVPIGLMYEVVFVDDGSADDTWQRIDQIAQARPKFRGIRLSRNFGKEAALSAGLQSARGDAVIVIDGDLQHPPSLIPEMIAIWQRGEADIVEAVKEHRGHESMLSRWRAQAFYEVLRMMSGFDLQGMSDFKLLDRKVVREWSKLEERNRFFRGMVAWLGFRRARLPFVVQDRAHGESAWSTWRLVWLAVVAITSFSTLPLHFSTAAGLVFAATAVLLGAQTFHVWLSGEAVAGFTTVILLLLIIGSAVLLSVGVIGEYVARIYHEVKRRPPYVVSDSAGRGLPENYGGDLRSTPQVAPVKTIEPSPPTVS